MKMSSDVQDHAIKIQSNADKLQALDSKLLLISRQISEGVEMLHKWQDKLVIK